jgi:hypothetical protein
MSLSIRICQEIRSGPNNLDKGSETLSINLDVTLQKKKMKMRAQFREHEKMAQSNKKIESARIVKHYSIKIWT